MAIPEILVQFPDFTIVIVETPIPKAQLSGIGKLMRPKLQKQSALKLAGLIIPRSVGYDNPQLALGYCTRD